MREILFRGKTLLNKKWVEGSLLKDEKGMCYIGAHIEMEDKAGFILASRKQGKTHNRFAVMGFVQVDPETVCQFTGRYDWENNKIFEHDIVSIDNGYAEVIWDEEDAKFIIDGEDASDVYEDFSVVDSFDLIIKGNVFDNPELMEGGGSDE